LAQDTVNSSLKGHKVVTGTHSMGLA
jgi:hypothetical protein